MQINRKFFPEVMQDNESMFFAHLEGIIDSVDELSTMEITKKPKAYHFRLAPSLPKYNNPLIEELIKFHNMFGIRMNMSKSIKTSAIISFEINLEMSK
jgi:DNA-binding phage protein